MHNPTTAPAPNTPPIEDADHGVPAPVFPAVYEGLSLQRLWGMIDADAPYLRASFIRDSAWWGEHGHLPEAHVSSGPCSVPPRLTAVCSPSTDVQVPALQGAPRPSICFQCWANGVAGGNQTPP